MGGNKKEKRAPRAAPAANQADTRPSSCARHRLPYHDARQDGASPTAPAPVGAREARAAIYEHEPRRVDDAILT